MVATIGSEKLHMNTRYDALNDPCHVPDIPNDIEVYYSPNSVLRCSRSPCRIFKLVGKNGQGDRQQGMEEPRSPKSNEMAECFFLPQQPPVCDTLKNLEGLSRVVPRNGNGVEMPRGISLHTVPTAVSYQLE